jgi:hypothetical protein
MEVGALPTEEILAVLGAIGFALAEGEDVSLPTGFGRSRLTR